MASVPPYSSYSVLLNQSCWKLPNAVKIDPPIQVANCLSTEFLGAMTRHLNELEVKLDISNDKRWSSLENWEWAPHSRILPQSSLRISTSILDMDE